MRNEKAFTDSFRRLNLRFSRIYGTLLGKADLSLQQFTLLNMLNSMGRIPMTIASKALHVSKPAVTNLVDGLEQRKLIKRIAHPEDRRVNLLELQPKGKKLVESIQTVIFGILLKTVHRFSTKEQDTIHKFYDGMSAEMDRVLSK